MKQKSLDMATIKQDRKDLEMLLNGVAPVQPVQAPAPTVGAPPAVQPVSAAASVVDNTADTSLPTEKLFEFDYEALKKSLRKKARKSVMAIAKHILTDEQLEEEYVQDKIEQDIETMADLYMQVESNNTMQRSILDQVSRGNTMPRMYEVFSQMTDKIQAINKQIQTTEQQMRRTYIDLKLEIKDKESEMRDTAGAPALTAPSGTSQDDGSIIVTSSKQLLENAKKKHRESIERAKETQYTEE